MRNIPPGWAEFMTGLEGLERYARENSLPIAARGLNNAKNAAGWELSGNLDRAVKATRGERCDG